MSSFDKPVSQFMTRPVVTIAINEDINQAQKVMLGERVSCLAVVGRDGKAAGVISYSDLLQIGHALARSYGENTLLKLPGMCAGDLMTTQILSTDETASITTAAATMVDRKIQRLFVLENGTPVGVLSARDLMRVVIEARIETPIGDLMTAPVNTLEVTEPLSQATNKLLGARLSGLVLLDKGAVAGIFTQPEALAAKDLEGTTPVADAAGYSVICLSSRTPVWRAARFALATRARRVVVTDHGNVTGIMSGWNFARAAKN